MTLPQTPNYGFAYLTESTPLRQLAEVTRQVAERADTVLGGAGVQPPVSFTPARGSVIEALRTATLVGAANQSGALLIAEGTGTVYAGRRYRVTLGLPQAITASTDRLSVRLQAGPDTAPVDVHTTYHSAAGGPVFIPSKRLTLPAGTARIRAYATRDVGTAAWSLFAADPGSPIVLSLDDIGAVP